MFCNNFFFAILSLIKVKVKVWTFLIWTVAEGFSAETLRGKKISAEKVKYFSAKISADARPEFFAEKI